MKKFFLVSLLFSLSAFAEVPPYAVVKSIQIDGSGCDAGSANAVMTNDLNFLSVLYNNFSVEIGKGTSNPGGRAQEKKCTIQVMIDIPPGWNFDFDSVEYRGFVQLPNKMTKAYQIVQAEVYGGRGIGFDTHLMSGPKNENYSMVLKNSGTSGLKPGGNILDKLTGIINLGGQIQSGVFGNRGCSATPQETKVKIKSVIGVRNLLADLTKPAVRMVVDSTDASFKQSLHLNWYRCR